MGELSRLVSQICASFTLRIPSATSQVYGVSTVAAVRAACLAALSRLLHYATPEQLRHVLLPLPLAAFLAAVVGGRDAAAALTALTMAEVLLTQLPLLYAPLLLKEGVVHAIETLAAAPLAGTPSSSSAAAAAAAAASTPVAATPTTDGTPVSRRSTRARTDRAVATTPVATTPAAAATPVLSTPAAGPSPATVSGARAAAISAARAFKAAHLQHGSAAGGAVRGETEGLVALRALGARLSAVGGDAASHTEALAALLRLLAAREGVSTFEFVGSGAAGALRDFLAPAGADIATEVTSHPPTTRVSGRVAGCPCVQTECLCALLNSCLLLLRESRTRGLTARAGGAAAAAVGGTGGSGRL